jgi:hypothetical protein
MQISDNENSTNSLTSSTSNIKLQEATLKKMKTFVGSKPISIGEIWKIIDKLIIVNKIIEINISPDLLVVDTLDINNFKQIIFDLNKNFSKDNLENILCSNRTLNINSENEENRIQLIKSFILMFSYLIHYSQALKSNNFIEYLFLIFKIVKKLFKEKALCEREIVIFLKYVITMSFFFSIITENLDRRGKNIKNIIYVWLVIAFLKSLYELDIQEEKEGNLAGPKSEQKSNNESINIILSETLIFIEKNLLINFNNICILGDTTKFLSLIELTKSSEILSISNRNKILELINRVYGHNMDINAFRYLLTNFSEGFLDTSRINQKILINSNYLPSTTENAKLIKNLKMIDASLDIFREFLIYEQNQNISDNFSFKNGFILNESLKTGIKLTPILTFPKKGYSLIFSFRWTPEFESKDKRMTLISFVQTKEDSNQIIKKNQIKEYSIMAIYIQNSKLYISIKDVLDLNFYVKENESYLVNILQFHPGMFSRNRSNISVFVNNKIVTTSEISGYPSGNMQCELGYQTIADENLKVCDYHTDFHFSGIFGTVLLFNEVLNSDTLNKINELKGEYEKMLMMNYERSQPLNNQNIKKNMEIFFAHDEKLRVEHKLVMIISSRVSLKLK